MQFAPFRLNSGLVLRAAIAAFMSICLLNDGRANSDVVIKGGLNKGGRFTGTNPKVFVPTKPASVAGVGSVKSLLNLGRGVTVTTLSNQAGNGDLSLAVELAKTGKRASTLTLQSERDLVISKPIRTTRSPLGVALKAGRNMTVTAPITTLGGNISIQTQQPFSLGAPMTVGTGQILIQAGSVESETAQTLAASTVDIATGATLRMRGTVNGILSVNGTVMPGARGISELQVNGNLALQPGGTTAVNLGASNKAGKIVANGPVALAGALRVDCVDGFEDLIVSTNSFTILTAPSITGTFEGIADGERVFLPDELGSLKVTYTATSVTLSDWQPIIVNLTWDPGTEDAGTNVFTNSRVRGRRHYFRVHTEVTDIGAWRSRLTPDVEGEADLYLRKGVLPSTGSNDFRSNRVGADGFVLHNGQFASAQEWFLLVYADPGKAWSVLSGRAYVQDLGLLPWNDLDNNGTYQIGEPPIAHGSGPKEIYGEGVRFYKATLPSGTPALSLWLHGSDKAIAARHSAVPFAAYPDLFDRKQNGRLLVVPPVIVSEVGTYFVSVVGNPGESVELDSRIQEVTDIGYNSVVENVDVPDAPFRVYRVQVPPEQIAWDVSTIPLLGDPNIAIRRGFVAGESDNDAYSEVAGQVRDSITLVPSFLTDGSWYITVYGDSAYQFTLRNGPPIITPINFTDVKINDQPERAGWRYFGLSNIEDQLGAYGWMLELANQVPGTEIALRRNAVPSRWRQRKDGKSLIIEKSVVEFSDKRGFLDRPAHQPDVWYVGVYMPTETLGAFTLTTRPLLPQPVAFDGGTQTVENLEAGRWTFFHVNVPPGVDGWDVRVRNVTGAMPVMAVRHDLLPEIFPPQPLGNIPGGWQSSKAFTWPTGNQWRGSVDWTGYGLEADGSLAAPGLVSAMTYPLEPGSYYIGVLNTSATESTTFTVQSRGIGAGQACPVTNLAYHGGTATITDLPPREARYFKVSIPPNTPSWEVLVDATVGDVQLMARYEAIPDFNPAPGHSIYYWDDMGEQTEVRKIGHERYVLLPDYADFIPPGDYYLAVVSEGVNPLSPNIGTETSSAVIRSLGPLAVPHLGTASPSGINEPVELVAGQVKAYQFNVPPDSKGLEVRLLNAVNAPIVTIIPGPWIPSPENPGKKAVYGLEGGPESTSSTFLITGSNPNPGVWSVLVHAPTTGDASAILNIVSRGTQPVAFDGGTSAVTDHLPGTWRYFTIQVPPDAVGWDLRIRDLVGPEPNLMIRRDLVPSLVENSPSFIPQGWQCSNAYSWPSQFQWLATVKDWTGFSMNPGAVVLPSRAVMGMGRPLQPGTYYAGVYHRGSEPISYVLDSRGIGAGMTYPVTNLAYVGGTAQVNIANPREARYFRVDVPADCPSWEVVLTPGVGEVELLSRYEAIPDFHSAEDGSVYGANTSSQVEMKKSGAERYVLLPDKDLTAIPAGSYYLAVVSEGDNPALNSIGTGPIEAQLTSVGPLAVKDLGVPTQEGTREQVDLDAGQIRAYRVTVPQFTQSLEVRLDFPVGNPQISLAQGDKLPTPAAFGQNVKYGWNSGLHGTTHNNIITVANPPVGTWSILVRGGRPSGSFPFGPSSAELVVTALINVPLEYDGGSFPVTNQGPNSWRYFSVEVPEGVLGWDIRVRDVTGAIPTLLVRRDQLPFVEPNKSPANFPTSWAPTSSTSWPTGNQWLGSTDWTGYLNATGHPSGPPGIVAATGRPLEPGTYYIGVFNNRLTPTNYTIVSRGIGVGRFYEVADLPFAGGSAVITDLLPREPKYFKVTVPAETQSWELSVGTTIGDLQLAVRRDRVPDFNAVNASTIYNNSAPQFKIRKSGAERYLLLSDNTTDLIPAGDYYLAVVSDGINPNRTSNIVGTGASSGVVTSHGVHPVTDLGSVTVAGTSSTMELVSTQVKAFRFDVPIGTESIEVRLENTVGYPEFTMASGTRLLAPPPISAYGGTNGGGAGTTAPRIQTFVNPKPGPWVVMVRATEAPPSEPDLHPDAEATLVVRQKPNLPLNFDAALNANGQSDTDERHAIDKELHIYKVTPPATLNGEPVLGWVIRMDLIQGSASVRVFKDFTAPTSGILRPAGTTIVVPPYLTFDQPWYVRVEATGTTHYRITSRALTLERPAWTMPQPHNVTFGDSGIDQAGNPLPGDRGIDLEQGSWHFYAFDVPANNQGLLRTELQGISGNPDLYIREDGVPTTDHGASGNGGSPLVHRTLTNVTTSYGNWVPLDGKIESKLKPGRWFLGVKANGNSNVRYRLVLSTGNVRELALDPASATVQIPNEVSAQPLADNDWRYYRFTVPEAAPQNWTLSFAQVVGDVVMRVRDTLPPGQKKLNSISPVEVADISTDSKNQGPYIDRYELPGDYTLTTPPLRPGNVYYVGFRSNNSATFNFRSSTSGGAVVIPPALDFYTGSVNTTVPANSSVMYRVIAPPEGTLLKYTAVNSAAISIRIEQGTLAGVAGSQHLVSNTANASNKKSLSTTSWPWQPAQTYYVRFVNNSTVAENIQFSLSGKNAQTEEEDGDGLLDQWEYQYFSSLSQTATGDPDGDGVTNAVEFADGTLPNSAASAKYVLTVAARNGSAAVTPLQPKYDRGSLVSLSSTPAPGYDFVCWAGGPLRLDDFAIKATGTITIPTAGTWTFGIHSGDGARLNVNGIAVITDGTVHDARSAFGQITLAAGSYPIELVAYERTGGESLELFAALGSFTSIQPEFRLVGDIGNGGLSVQSTIDGTATAGFLVRQVAVLTGTISSLTAADNILNTTAANRIELTGSIGSINFLDYSAYEGHFPDNAHFPLTAGMEDQPMELRIEAAYTMTALHSLPLGVGTDAEDLAWDSGGNMPWLAENDAAAAFDGVDVAVSGPIGDSQNSSMHVTLQGPGTLTFRWRVSSQSGDNFVVNLDGLNPVTITGETAWVQRSIIVPAGVHRVNWIYSKNSSGSAGSDRGFVDQVTFTQ